MEYEIGSRVGAIFGTEGKKVQIFGYGVYEGDFDPDDPNYAPAAVGNVADMARVRYEAFMQGHFLNPRIKLDSGKVVWGAECWWGPEDKIQDTIKEYEKAGYQIVEVDIYEEREKYRKQKCDCTECSCGCDKEPHGN